MLFAISDATWNAFFAALIPLMVALAAWLRGEYKDYKIAKEAKAANDKAEVAQMATESLHDELAEQGTVQPRPKESR